MKFTGIVLMIVTTVLAAVGGCGRAAPSSQERKATEPAVGGQGSDSRTAPVEGAAAPVEPPVTPDEQQPATNSP